MFLISFKSTTKFNLNCYKLRVAAFQDGLHCTSHASQCDLFRRKITCCTILTTLWHGGLHRHLTARRLPVPPLCLAIACPLWVYTVPKNIAHEAIRELHLSVELSCLYEWIWIGICLPVWPCVELAGNLSMVWPCLDLIDLYDPPSVQEEAGVKDEWWRVSHKHGVSYLDLHRGGFNCNTMRDIVLSVSVRDGSA